MVVEREPRREKMKKKLMVKKSKGVSYEEYQERPAY